MGRVVVVAAVVAVLVACGSPEPTSGPAATAAAEAAPLDFSAPGVMGGRIDGADLAGRDLALWFWAPW